MKALLLIISAVLLAMAALSTPVAIGVAIYNFAFSEAGIAIALWEGFKVWISMLGTGLLVGYPMFIYAQS